ncbi:hypothetical protein SY83_13845 [Paenibacillus swuensis]|uniref:Uncharacterized protein n=1 Tax=Paenibacillus swuensis TaxID=1178515 RepID=A0A172TJD6_9BACL|nr:rod shape-determining protein MreD [Paenibacillus swuensis]ANE47169.1 hypothetical protein SY83_13845 [Paenibacillus swuensis]
MRRNLSIILLVLFVLEGSIFPWLIPGSWQDMVRFAPHLAFVVIIYIAIFLNRYYALTFGLLFGALHDIIYYNHMLGIYTFCMGVTAYIAGFMFRGGVNGIAQAMIIIIWFNFLLDSMIYGIYMLFSKTTLEYSWVFMHMILPSLFINALFALMIYIPLRRYLEGRSVSGMDDDAA